MFSELQKFLALIEKRWNCTASLSLNVISARRGIEIAELVLEFKRVFTYNNTLVIEIIPSEVGRLINEPASTEWFLEHYLATHLYHDGSVYLGSYDFPSNLSRVQRVEFPTEEEMKKTYEVD